MNKYPLINFTVAFICGIILQKYLNLEPVFIIAAASVIISAVAFFIFILRNKIASILVQIMIYSSVLLLGSLDLSLSIKPGNILPKKLFYAEVILWGDVKNVNLMKDYGFDFEVRADSLSAKNKNIRTNILLLCRYFHTGSGNANSLFNKMSIGSKVMLKGKLTDIRKSGNPGEYDYSAVLRDRGINGIIYINKTDAIHIKSVGKSLSDYLLSIRKEIDKKIKDLQNSQSAALLRGLLLADRSLIDIELKSEFVNAGVIHLLAVSGLHVGYIILIILIFTGRLNLYLRSVITIAGLIFFTLITGLPSSVVRASTMAIILIIAFLSGRSTNLINSLAFAALIILLFNPGSLFEPGFQLSFSAVLSIGIFYPYFRRVSLAVAKDNSLLKNLLLFLSVSVAAQIATIPIIIYYFGKISVIGIFANIIAIPAVGVIVGIGIATIIAGFLIPALAVYFAATNDVLIMIFNWFVGFAGSLKYSNILISDFSIIDIFIFYAFLILLMVSVRKFTGLKSKVILYALVMFNIIIYCSLDDRMLTGRNKFNLLMIDVGQGDSFLLKFPNGKTALIDAGMTTVNYDIGERKIMPLLRFLKIDTIDYAFVSHIDADHYSGFVSIVHSGIIKNIYKPFPDSLSDKDVRFEKFLKKSNIRIHYFSTGIKKIGNVCIYIMNAGRPGTDYKNSTNDKSGFFKVVYGKTSILFTGDLEKTAERYYSRLYGNFLKSEVLKISHHGSAGATSGIFLKFTDPQICLISAGLGNKFGHPAYETLKKLSTIGAKIIRTDISGAAILQSDGQKISLVEWK